MNFDDLRDKMRRIGEEHFRQRAVQSWHLQGREERNARMQAILELSAELMHIKTINRFATGVGESVIEDIIQGDWKRARQGVQMLRFAKEDEELRAHYAPLWEKFVIITETLCDQALVRQAGGNANPS